MINLLNNTLIFSNVKAIDTIKKILSTKSQFKTIKYFKTNNILIASVNDKPKILLQTITGDKNACLNIRINQPHSFLNTEANIIINTQFSKANTVFTNKYDRQVFINQRIPFADVQTGLKYYEAIKKCNYLYIMEIDDHPIYWEKYFNQSKWINFISTHAIQVSTPYIKKYLEPYNPNIKVFQNQIAYLPPFNFRNNKTINIFFGAINRDKEFQLIIPLLNQITNKYDIHFKIIGHPTLFNQLKGSKELLNNAKTLFINYDNYLRALDDSDIAILPLIDTEFNRAKSDLKFLECAAHCCCTLCSPVVYSNTVKDNETGLIYHNNNEFISKLTMLIENTNLRKQIVINAYEYILNHRLLSQHYLERLEWYESLFKQHKKLIDEADERISLLLK